MLDCPLILKMRQYVRLLVAYSIRARESVRKGLPNIIGFVQDLITKKFVRTLICPIMIGTPHTMPTKLAVLLFAVTIRAVLILLGKEVIGSIAFSATSLFMVLSLAPKSRSARKEFPLMSIGTLGQSLRRCSIPIGLSYGFRSSFR